jgi:hypothetical protein
MRSYSLSRFSPPERTFIAEIDDPDLVRLYGRFGFRCDLVTSRRIVGASAASRGEVSEYVVHGGSP